MNLIVVPTTKIQSVYDAYAEWKMGSIFYVANTNIVVCNKDAHTLKMYKINSIAVKVGNCYFILFKHYLGI